MPIFIEIIVSWNNNKLLHLLLYYILIVQHTVKKGNFCVRSNFYPIQRRAATSGGKLQTILALGSGRSAIKRIRRDFIVPPSRNANSPFPARSHSFGTAEGILDAITIVVRRVFIKAGCKTGRNVTRFELENETGLFRGNCARESR